jgi:vancomycin resistance protein VanW
MNKGISEKPIHRSVLRLKLGAVYFTLGRHIKWLLGGYNFPRIENNSLPYTYFSHSTPLLRQLKDVDMHLQYNKITNLKIAVSKLNRVTLRPGETLSYWKLIGRPTKRKGYLKGMILQNGRYKSGTGGGLCQLSNLIYWMTIHTPLTVIERHRHGYDVFPDSNRTQPFGSGATCFYNYGDLMIKNNTNEIFQLVLNVTDTDLVGSWACDSPPQYKYEVYEKEHVMQPEFWGGYTRHNMIYRKRFDMAGGLLSDEYVIENHAVMMYAPFISEINKEL